MKVVVFIDVQKDFVSGVLKYVYPEQPNHMEIIEFAKKCRARGYQLFATADTHERTVYDPTQPESNGEKVPTYGYFTTLEGKHCLAEHCIRGTTGHQIIDGLVKDENGDVIIPQGHIIQKSTFGSLGLAGAIENYVDELKEPLEEILICGYCTSICVVSNALILRAKFPNTPMRVIWDLCGDCGPECHKAALKVMHNCMIHSINADSVFMENPTAS